VTRTAVIEQPNYIPWIGYFDLIAQADVWIWYDDVQYTKRDWRNRNRVAANGPPVWLTIPVKTKGRFAQPICDVEIDETRPWVRTHLETLRRCYARAPFYEQLEPLLRESLEAPHARLADLTISLNESLCRLLGIAPPFLRSSRMPLPAGDRLQRLVEICRIAGATAYLSGPAARAYLEPSLFADAGIELRYIVYDYPPYARGRSPFIPQLSIVDALAWLGPEATRAYLGQHRRTEREAAAC
jgi:hypothetical protein